MKFLYKKFSNLDEKGRVFATALTLLFVTVLANFANIPDFAYWQGRLGLGPKIVARVGREAITQDELTRVAASGKISDEQALELLVDTARMASYYGTDLDDYESVRFSPEEESAAKDLLFRDRLKEEILSDPYLKILYINSLFKQRVARQLTGAASGTLLVFPYSRYISGAFTEPTPLTDDPRAIAADKEYAKDKAESVRGRALSGESLEALLNEVNSDSRLVGGNIGNWSRKFTEGDFATQQGVLSGEDLRSHIINFGKLGISEIAEGSEHKARRGDDSGTGELIGTHYFFVNLASFLQPKTEIINELNKITVRRYV